MKGSGGDFESDILHMVGSTGWIHDMKGINDLGAIDSS